jgi:hypothetical protein
MWFHRSPTARREGLQHAPRFSRRPQLEALEDRVVPSIADGTILVATSPSPFSFVDQSAFPTGIIGVNRTTAAQSPVSTGGFFSAPRGIAEALNSQQLYVADLQTFGTGAIIQVDPNSGQQTLLSGGGLIFGPIALTFQNGNLYVVDQGDGSGFVHDLVQVDLVTGAQTVITTGGGFLTPTGIAPAPGNNVYVSDAPGGFFSFVPGGIWQVDLATGQQTSISQGGLLNHPVDVAVEPGGSLMVANSGDVASNTAATLVRVNPQTGTQNLVASFPADTGLSKVTVGADGTIFVDAISNGLSPGRIFAVNPVTGAQSTVVSGGSLSLAEGITIFRATSTGGGNDITAALDAATGLLSIRGNTGNNVFTIEQVAPGVIRITGNAGGGLSSAATTVNGLAFTDFTSGAVSGINIELRDGNENMKMTGVSIPGDVVITAGIGVDTFTLNTITARSINIMAAGAATVSVFHATTLGDLGISVGPGSRSVAVTSSTILDLTIKALSAAGDNIKFNLENDTVRNEAFGGLSLTDTGVGNDTVKLSNILVYYYLGVTLGGGYNTVTAANVAVTFGMIDGGEPNSLSNLYFDDGGNFGFIVFNFVGH